MLTYTKIYVINRLLIGMYKKYNIKYNCKKCLYVLFNDNCFFQLFIKRIYIHKSIKFSQNIYTSETLKKMKFFLVY